MLQNLCITIFIYFVIGIVTLSVTNAQFYAKDTQVAAGEIKMLRN